MSNTLIVIDQNNLQVASQQLWQELKKYLGYLSDQEVDLINLAFDYTLDKHGEQRRKSNEFYIVHPVATAINLAKIELDSTTLVAALLHDVPEDTFADPNEGIQNIKKEFGSEVAFLVSGITKLSAIKYSGEKRYVENLRRLFIAMSKDLRVIFIKLADRLHNLQTLKYLREDKAQRIALESLEIYAPIAERLGISSLRTQIENYAFKFAYPIESQKFVNVPELDMEKRQKTVGKLIKKTTAILNQLGIPYKKVVGRSKTHYSVFRKMEMENKNIDQILDLIALRIVTNSISDCYRIMSILMNNFEIIEDKTKDYIQNPKLNGYQSLHLTGKDSKIGTYFEFQIRTQKMHDFAEFGVAAHWWYKEYMTEGRREDFLDMQSFKWIEQLVSLSKKPLTETDYLKQVKLNVFPDRIFVLTPRGDVIDLPAGATALDFAFKIHDFIGVHAHIAKINGKVSKLNDKLKNGDSVEIITSKKQKPTSDWLSWAKSESTTKKIKYFLRGILNIK